MHTHTHTKEKKKVVTKEPRDHVEKRKGISLFFYALWRLCWPVVGCLDDEYVEDIQVIKSV